MFRELTLPGFVWLSRASRNASRRHTERGRMLQTGAVICAALGVDTDLTLIYQLFALLACTLLVSRVALALRKPRVTVRRRLPHHATAHEPFGYYIDITNEGGKVERDLALIDNPSVIPPTASQFQRYREPGEESRNAYDRWLGFHRFVWLQQLNTGITLRSANVQDIPQKFRAGVQLEATPLRRGVVHFESISVLHPDPFGLNYGITNFEAADQLLVLPRRYPLPGHVELPGSRHFQPGAASATWSIGESDEFVSLRDYRDGDSMRKIHWPSTAKRTKPVVKEFQDEYFVRQALVLDNSAQPAQVFEEAISVAASFIARMNDADSMVDLIYLTSRPEIVTAGRGATSTTHQLEVLAGLGHTSLPIGDLRDTVLRCASRISGCILVLTDWCEARNEMIERLMGRSVPVKVLLVSDRHAESELPVFVSLLTPGNVPEGLARL